MNHQTQTTVRELNLQDLDRVSGAKHPDIYAGKHPDGGAPLADFLPGPSSPAAMRGVTGPEI
jgi:hypothetical protein